MKLAAKKAELSACPYASEEAKTSSAPPASRPSGWSKIGPPEREVSSRQRDGHVPPREDLRAPDRDRAGLLRRPADCDESVAPDGARSASTAWSASARSCGSTWCWSRTPPAPWSRSSAAVKAVAGERAAGSSCSSDESRRAGGRAAGARGPAPLIHAATPAERRAIGRAGAEVQGPAGGARRDARRTGGADRRSWPAWACRTSCSTCRPTIRPPTLQYNTIIRKAALKDTFEPLGYPILNFVTGRRPAVARGGRVNADLQVRVHPGARHACSTRRCCR